MKPLNAGRDKYSKDMRACHGCSLCVLVCPVWRERRDLCHTSQGRAKTFQHDQSPDSLRDSLYTCVLCGSCNAICPEGIDLNGELIKLRASYHADDGKKLITAKAMRLISETRPGPAGLYRGKTVLLPGRALGMDMERAGRVVALLGGEKKIVAAEYSGEDLSMAFEAGVTVPAGRVEGFLDSLRGASEIIVADGIMKRMLREGLRKTRIEGLGERLISIDMVRRKIMASDLYVIESRSYNMDIGRLAPGYEQLRGERGCSMNLDLHRVAVPTSATSMHGLLQIDGIDCREQARWILKGRDVKRVIVESMEDAGPLKEITDLPVFHVADIVEK